MISIDIHFVFYYLPISKMSVLLLVVCIMNLTKSIPILLRACIFSYEYNLLGDTANCCYVAVDLLLLVYCNNKLY